MNKRAWIVVIIGAVIVAFWIVGTVMPRQPRTQPSPTPTTVDLASFEEDNGIDTADWYDHVTGKEVKLGALWVSTDLPDSDTSTGGRMCGAYAQYVLVDPAITVTYVRAESGLRLAKCGPGA